MTEIAQIDDQLAGYVEAMHRAYGEIESAQRIDEVKDIRDRAEAARQYARAAGYSRDITNMCAEIKLRAERKAGTLLREMDRRKPEEGRPVKALQDERLPRPTLKDLGVSETQSHRWQRTASIPEDVFEGYIQSVREDETGTRDLITSSGLRQQAARLDRLRQMADEAELANPYVPIRELIDIRDALRRGIRKMRALKDAGQSVDADALTAGIASLCKELEELL